MDATVDRHDNLGYSCLAESCVRDPVAIEFFFITVLTGEGLGGILAKEVVIVVLASKILGPVLTSHWVHGGLDEDGDHVQPVEGVEGAFTYFHGQRLRRSTL